MVSYAQNYEDVMLRRALQDVQCGFWVDVGAWDPTYDSVTRWFRESGWTGVNVEPHPDYLAQLERERPEEVNLGLAVGDIAGRSRLILLGDTGLSTLSETNAAVVEAASHGRTGSIEVETITLDDLLVTHAKGRIVDFLKLDVEGLEGAILRAATFTATRPRILVVEATFPNSQEPTWQEWEPQLLAKDYLFAWFDGLNRFYVRTEDAWRLAWFRIPPCVFDNFVPNSVMLAKSRMAEAESRGATLEAQCASIEERATAAEGLAMEWRQRHAVEATALAHARRLISAQAGRTEHFENLADAANQHAQELQGRVETLSLQLKALLDSTSWRITQPLRTLKCFLELLTKRRRTLATGQEDFGRKEHFETDTQQP
jgi:FkbM family methyltransferase